MGKGPKELEKQVRKEPTNLALKLRLAAAYQEVGDSVSSVKWYEEVIASYVKEERFEQARVVCNAALEANPDHPRLSELLVDISRRVLPTTRLATEPVSSNPIRPKHTTSPPPGRSGRSTEPPRPAGKPERRMARETWGEQSSWQARAKWQEPTSKPGVSKKNASGVDWSAESQLTPDPEEDAETMVSGEWTGPGRMTPREQAVPREIRLSDTGPTDRHDVEIISSSDDLPGINVEHVKPAEETLLESGMNEALVQLIAPQLAYVSYEPGERILGEREPADSAFLLANGQVGVWRSDPMFARQPATELRRFADISWFGWSALWGQLLRTGSMYAISPCGFWVLPATVVMSLNADAKHALFEFAKESLWKRVKEDIAYLQDVWRNKDVVLEPRYFAQGDVLPLGGEGACFFTSVQGNIQIAKTLAPGRHTVLAQLSSGCYLVDASVLLGKRSGKIELLFDGPTTCLCLPVRPFLQFVTTHPARFEAAARIGKSRELADTGLWIGNLADI